MMLLLPSLEPGGIRDYHQEKTRVWETEKMRKTNLESLGPLQRCESPAAEALASPRSVILDVCVYSSETILQRPGILAVRSHRPGLESQPCHFLALDFGQIILSPPASISDSVDEDDNETPHGAAQGVENDGRCEAPKAGVRNPGAPPDIRKHRGCSSELCGSHSKPVKGQGPFPRPFRPHWYPH